MLPAHVPVLIIGAGTVGLSAAAFLGHWGAPALVVERHRGISIHPRAVGVGVRTMELFRSIGLEAAIREAATLLANNSGVISAATLASAELPRLLAERPAPPAAESPFSPTSSLACSQDALDPVLCADAQRHGATVAFGTELVALDQDASGVTAHLRERDGGAEHTVRADYLIAADGAGSFVRRELGIPASGPGALGAHLINALFEADLAELVGPRPFQLCQINSPDFTGLIIAIRSNRRWVLHVSYDPARGQHPDDFTVERCEELIRAAIGLRDIAVEVLSVLPWQVVARVADRFQAGCIFLAGDAAAIVPPTGGFGMNTGIAGAHNLAWKLALVLGGKAAPALLDSYEAECRPVAQFTMDQALLRLRHPQLHWDIARVAERTELGIAELDVVHLGQRYAAGAILAPVAAPRSLTDLGSNLDASPGTRLPHHWGEWRGERRSTLDLVASRFLLLAGEHGQEWCDAARAAAARLDLDLATYRVGPSGDLSDPDGQLRSAYGLGDNRALLVRPDGIIAWRASQASGDMALAIEQALQSLLGYPVAA